MNLVRSLHEATGLSPADETDIRSKMPTSPFRKLVEYDLEKRKLEAQADATTDFKKGVVEGLVVAVGILNRPNKSS